MRKLIRKSERKKITRIKYKKQKCKFVSRLGIKCKRYAVGKSTLCERHGGVKITKELLISAHDDNSLTAKKFNLAVHPILFVDLSSKGMSVEEIAAEMKVTPSSLKKWSETYKEFSVAWEIGKACHEAWWLRTGKDNLNSPRFQTALFKFMTTNKLGYAEKIETKSHNINENIGVLLVPAEMSVEEWENNNKKDDGEVLEAEYTEVPA